MEPAHQPCMGATDQDRSSSGNEGGRTGEREEERRRVKDERKGRGKERRGGGE